MIAAAFFQTREGCYAAFEIKGHAVKDHTGFSLICASATTLTQTCITGLKDVLGVRLALEKEESGLVRCSLPKGLDQEMQGKTDLLIEVFKRGLLYLQKDVNGQSQIMIDTMLIP